jgi:hypothetical protein
LKPQVNKAVVQLPYNGSCYTVDYSGQFIRLNTNFCVGVEFSKQAIVKVFVPHAMFKGLMHGMCGADSKKCNDDYRLNNGTYVGHSPKTDEAIGDSYIVPDSDVLSNGSVMVIELDLRCM